MHHVSSVNDRIARTPKPYEKFSSGFRRATYVDHAAGSVHMGVGICYLDSPGTIRPHVHSFEESFYVLSGNPTVQIGDQSSQLRPGHFGLIGTGKQHAWRNTSDAQASWLEMQAPQPRSLEYGRDTFFSDGDGSWQGTPLQPPDWPDPIDGLLGHFDESALPRPGGPSQMEGFNPTTGVAIKMFVDRSFGAIHQSLFVIQYASGAKIDPHDHTFEESYYILSGRVQACADGKTYDLGPGDVIWTSVGCIHSFANTGTEPVRWIETQAPLPPAKEVFRFERDWNQLATH